MISTELSILGGVLFLLGLELGFLLTKLRSDKIIHRLSVDNERLEIELEQEQTLFQEKMDSLEEARLHLKDSFTALSHHALRDNNEQFLKLATENLKQHQLQAEAGLQRKEQAIETLVKPIQNALEKTEKQIAAMEKERVDAYSSLREHLRHMAENQNTLQLETRNLVQALRRPEVRGQWGELTLKRLVELAGMVEHCDFFEQEHHNNGEATMRPDMIVRMPENREIIIDAKTPLDAYLSAVEAKNDEERNNFLKHHARKVRERVRELSSKAYWSQFKHTPDFVVLFIPGDQFLSSALQQDSALLENALSNKVILATPTSIVALLRAIAYGWRQLSVAENSEKIRDLAEDMYKRLSIFTEHLARLGKNLNNSVTAYNQAVGSLERQVLPGARKFTELGIQSKKELNVLSPVEVSARMPVGSDESVN